MLTYVLITLYSLLFAFLVWRRFQLGLALLFMLLPAYLIRFNIGLLPTTLLEVMIGIVIGVWFLRRTTNKEHNVSRITYHVSRIIKQQPSLFIAIALFLIGATISIFTSTNLRAAIGEWKAFYVEPILIFLVLITTLNNQQSAINNNHLPQHITDHRSALKTVNVIIFALLLSGLATSALAIYQHFTGWMVPWAFWENHNTYRVTAWYGFPNGVGLFLAPLVPLAMYLIIAKIQDTRTQDTNKSQISNHQKPKCLSGNWDLKIETCLYLGIYILYLAASLLAIFYAKSTEGLVGVAAGISLLLFFYKRTRLITIIILASGLLTIFFLPANDPLKRELLLQDRSGQIRIQMWSEAIELLRERPFLGAGLASYIKRVAPYHSQVNGENIEIFHQPHNIFLTMWVNLGLIGLIGFGWVIVWFFRVGFSCNMKHVTYNKLTPFILSSMTVIIVTGFVDSPYIKNDLSLLFWLLTSFMVIASPANFS